MVHHHQEDGGNGSGVVVVLLQTVLLCVKKNRQTHLRSSFLDRLIRALDTLLFPCGRQDHVMKFQNRSPRPQTIKRLSTYGRTKNGGSRPSEYRPTQLADPRISHRDFLCFAEGRAGFRLATGYGLGSTRTWNRAASCRESAAVSAAASAVLPITFRIR